jgi:hypothetical protein
MIVSFFNVGNKFPGPQSYNIVPLINGTGKSAISKFRSSPGKTMAAKHDLNKLKVSGTNKELYIVPGPGTYNQFSEWGVYQSLVTTNSQNMSKN